ncbi:hypothetical protein GOP47_0002094 [Adiantum capillus-veneris]|uniref:Longin domain-containing protein n=1 Tax=Adiantum capillus-veneris TaxID=13818 RepID=A0A9D4V9I0_ADICA|nr:hypothetical protein GOP47_0002094 [Adiantum capillus-veneris]
MASPTSLVYYAAVAKGAVIVAEYISKESIGMSAIATSCLENIPPLHSKFSHMTNQRRFICIIDGIFTYCAIIDEALSKAEAFSYLQKNRDAFKSLYKGRGPDSETLTLGAHFLDEEMVPIMQQHAGLFVGVSQREKMHMEADLQTEQDTEVCPEVSSPTSVGARLDEEFQGFCCWQVGSWLKCLCESKQ